MATAITSAVLYQCVGARVQSYAWTQGQQILHTFLGHAPNSAMSVASLDILNRSQCFTVCALLVSSVVCTFREYHLYWYWKNVVPSSTCALCGSMFSRFHGRHC
ncbi:hypothetical protein BDR06DRAFT_957341 [Suillus hirtellus]|nr:hypothetical protein BDR06DRAFT_957341 [Suillus hirtellus]